MATKFKFKLDALLKLREFKEDKIKQEMGQILTEIGRVENLMAEINGSIAEAYNSQNEFLKEPTLGSMLQFFPYFIQGRKEDLAQKQVLLNGLNRQYQEKINELKIARGEVKVMEKMKEKKRVEFVKQVEKKRQEDIEDILNMKKVME